MNIQPVFFSLSKNGFYYFSGSFANNEEMFFEFSTQRGGRGNVIEFYILVNGNFNATTFFQLPSNTLEETNYKNITENELLKLINKNL